MAGFRLFTVVKTRKTVDVFRPEELNLLPQPEEHLKISKIAKCGCEML